MKLLYILPEYLPDSGGGIITFYGQLLPALVQAGHDVKVLVANHQSLDKPAREIQGVQVEYLKSHFVEKARLGCQQFNATLWAFMPIAWGAYEQMHGGEGYDIVEATDWMALYMPWVVSERKARVVVSLHGSTGQVDWYSNPEKRNFDGDIVRLAEATSLGLADAIHANSRANAQFWESKIHKFIRVIPPVMEIPKRVTQCEESHRGLVVGRLQNWKGVEVLCRALQGISELEIEWIGGDTQWDETIKSSEFLKKNYSNVYGSKLLWLGQKNYALTQQKLQCARFVVVPSTWDVFNLAAAEAMSHGVPVICSRNAGAEMLIENGVNGFLFDPEKPNDLSECLRKIVRISPHELNVIGENGRRVISERMNKNCILDELQYSYNELVKSPKTFMIDPWAQSFLKLVYSKKIHSNSNKMKDVIRKYIFRIGASICKKITNSLKFRARRSWRNFTRFRRVHLFPDPLSQLFRSVIAYDPQSDFEYNDYQRYYRNGLCEKLRVLTVSNLDGNSQGVNFTHHKTHVGQYIFQLKNGKHIKVAIDAHDHRDIRSEEILNWSDLYFKSNHWPSVEYPQKVRPIVNGNGMLTPERIDFLKSLRNHKKTLDFIFIAQIWAGGDANVEHNIRLFENLAKVDCKSKILAVLSGFQESDDDYKNYAARLTKAGVNFSMDHISYHDLMVLSAQSKCVFIRAGVSSCIPWRMLDMLCLGSSLILDHSPFPSWPYPLNEKEHFFNMGLQIGKDCSPAPETQYLQIPLKLMHILDDLDGQKEKYRQNSLYFDTHAAPEAVADYILKTVRDFVYE